MTTPSSPVVGSPSRNGLLPRTFGHSVRLSSRLIADSALTWNISNLVWKRGKDLLYLGSFHSGDLLELYNLVGDHLGTDAIGMLHPPHSFRTLMRVGSVNFINHYDPNYPEGSTAPSLLSNITWPKYTLDSKRMLLFSDNATEEYTTIPDTYRADSIAAITQLLTELGV